MIWLEIEGRNIDKLVKIHQQIFPRETILDKELLAFPCNISVRALTYPLAYPRVKF